AAGGVRGSDQDIENTARITDRLMGDDMQRWINQNMGLYGMGLQGEQGFYDTGFKGAQGISSDIEHALASQGTLAFQGEREKMKQEADKRSMWENILGAALGFGGTALKSGLF